MTHRIRRGHRIHRSQRPIPWRSAPQIRGVLSQLTAALRACDNGAYIELDIKTGTNLLELGHQLLILLKAQEDAVVSDLIARELRIIGEVEHANDP
jgi:hypothetical protein